jgi:hypothetical protein
MTRARAAPFKVRASRRPTGARFALCVNNGEYPASLEVWKIYRVVPDNAATRHDQLRVIDESGGSYLFPAEYFRLVELPSPLSRLYPSKETAHLLRSPKNAERLLTALQRALDRKGKVHRRAR